MQTLNNRHAQLANPLPRLLATGWDARPNHALQPRDGPPLFAEPVHGAPSTPPSWLPPAAVLLSTAAPGACGRLGLRLCL
jgi:hypothetical protein